MFRRVAYLGALAGAVCLYLANLLYGLNAAVQLFFSFVLGVVGSYIASLIFSRRVQKTVADIIGLESQVRNLTRQVKEFQRIRDQLHEATYDLAPEARTRLREFLRGLNEVHDEIQEAANRLDQSVKLIARIREE